MNRENKAYETTQSFQKHQKKRIARNNYSMNDEQLNEQKSVFLPSIKQAKNNGLRESWGIDGLSKGSQSVMGFKMFNMNRTMLKYPILEDVTQSRSRFKS